MRNLVTVFTGLIFGIGLIMSGMTNPAKVQNFLDIFGSWDPSLALVMGGAILITMPGFWLVKKRQTPFFEDAFLIPKKINLDLHLLTGSAIFGIGWGLGGFLPRSCSCVYFKWERRNTSFCDHNVNWNGFSEIINIEVAKKVKFKLKLNDYIFLVNPNNIEFKTFK